MEFLLQFAGQLPVILSLVVLESLLSVDNALVLAAMVSHLSQEPLFMKRLQERFPMLPVPHWAITSDQNVALRFGMIGAYVMRGASLFCVAWLYAHPALKLAGAFYLLYLMSSNLGKSGDDEDAPKSADGYGLLGTIIAVELADMSFSIDNIFAAAAFSPKFWVVCTGVFIGIAAMRFIAGWLVKLIEKLPILAKIAYVLVGSIGFQLIAEQVFGVDLTELQKFATIFAIIAVGIVYDKVPFVKTVLNPVFHVCALGMGQFTAWTEWAFTPVALAIDFGKSAFAKVVDAVKSIVSKVVGVVKGLFPASAKKAVAKTQDDQETPADKSGSAPAPLANPEEKSEDRPQQ